MESSLTREQERFFERVRARLGNVPRMEAALAYDDIMVLAAGLEACADATPLALNCVAKRMEATDYTGVAGKLDFDESRLSNRPDLLIRVKHGRWEELPHR